MRNRQAIFHDHHKQRTKQAVPLGQYGAVNTSSLYVFPYKHILSSPISNPTTERSRCFDQYSFQETADCGSDRGVVLSYNFNLQLQRSMWQDLIRQRVIQECVCTILIPSLPIMASRHEL
jgi:hypothetical protein